MRELTECRTEVFRRSEKRIKARKMRVGALALCVPLCLLVAVLSVTGLPPDGNMVNGSGNNSVLMPEANGGPHNGIDGPLSGSTDKLYGSTGGVPGNSDAGTVDSFSFSLVWGCNGISAYDSATGKLVKTTDATDPSQYVTTCYLTADEKQRIYELVKNLNVTSYPDVYDPQPDGVASSPSMTLILSVRTKTVNKVIRAENIALTYETTDSRGQKFLSTCKAIEDILTATDEWNALPEYEFIYN